MLKSKAWILGGVLVAALLPAPPVHASELVKLAKLLVTGKRAPAAAETVVSKPATPAREGADARWTPPRNEERSSAAPLRQEPNTDAMAGDWPHESAPVQSSRQPAPAPTPQHEAPRADPSPGRGAGDRFEVAAAHLFSRTLA